jgi:hypothetical protein
MSKTFPITEAYGNQVTEVRVKIIVAITLKHVICHGSLQGKWWNFAVKILPCAAPLCPLRGEKPVLFSDRFRVKINPQNGMAHRKKAPLVQMHSNPLKLRTLYRTHGLA